MNKKCKSKAGTYYSTRKKWFEREYWPKNHKNIFKPNGINSYQQLAENYSKMLELIDSDGKVIDLGCGNGLLLKWLKENSKQELKIYGVDFIKKSINQAKDINPGSKDNFFCRNIIKFNFDEEQFDFILIDPVNIGDDDFKWFLNKIYRNLKDDGKIIMYVQNDEINAFKKSDKVHYLKKTRVDWIYKGLLFGIIKKAKLKYEKVNI